MAFTRNSQATNNISALPNKPLITPTALKAAFDKGDVDEKSYNNDVLLVELESTTPGSSGAENIGSRTITGITGNTIWTQLQALYNLIVATVLGQIPDGSLTYAKQSTSAKALIENQSFKNKIINGDFVINQLGVSGTVILSAGQYGHDKWKAGDGGCTYTFATSQNKTTITISSGTLMQTVEGIGIYSGTHTVSWVGTSMGRIGTGAYTASGMQLNPTGGNDFSVEFNAGTLSQVQIEFGTVATAFEKRDISIEKLLCERYMKTFNVTTPFTYLNVGRFATTTTAVISFDTNAQMRTSPTISATGTFVLYHDGTNSLVTSYALHGTGSSMVSIAAIMTDTTTAGNLGAIYSGAAGGMLIFDANL